MLKSFARGRPVRQGDVTIFTGEPRITLAGSWRRARPVSGA